MKSLLDEKACFRDSEYIRHADGDNQITFRWRTIVKQTTEKEAQQLRIKVMQFSIFRKVA